MCPLTNYKTDAFKYVYPIPETVSFTVGCFLSAPCIGLHVFCNYVAVRMTESMHVMRTYCRDFFVIIQFLWAPALTIVKANSVLLTGI